MISKSTVLGSLSALVLLAIMGSPAQADPIVTSAIGCQQIGPSDGGLLYYISRGVFNNSTDSSPVVCGVNRSPVTSGTPMFVVRGESTAVGNISCTLYVYDGKTLRTSYSFTNPSSGEWSRSVLISSAMLSASDHVTMVCSLPPTVAGLHSITATSFSL